MIRIVVADDHALVRTGLDQWLGSVPDLAVVGLAADGREAVDLCCELLPDVVLMDYQMPKLNGFEVLELVGRQVPVIFTTAYDQYALKAFEVHAVDYLLKPFSEERLAEALNRVRMRLQVQDSAPDLDGLVDVVRRHCTT